MQSFKLTPKQDDANRLLASAARDIMLFGGSRSGKTFLLCRAIAVRALKAPGSRHAILRFRLNHVKGSIVHDTWPKMLKLCFPQVKCELNKADLFAQFENGSEVWFGGLDDKERTEKILGSEYSTIYLNECSQIPWNSRNIAVTRLAQLVYQEALKDEVRNVSPQVKAALERRPLPLKMYYDENPPDKGHWTYKLFKAKQDPETKRPLNDPDNYASMQINPTDNLENVGKDYLKTLESLPARLQKRFKEGEFREAAPNALFIDEVLDRWRVTDGDLPEMLRLVVGVDPSGADDEDNLDNDEIGIVVAGLGIDGNGYILEDLTCKAGPGTWGRVATQAFDRHRADRIVAEVNFGGAMVKAVIHSARPRTPFRAVTASRGKVVRAEPISSLMESGKVRLAGYHRALEDELCSFTTAGFIGDHSPNRADAAIWALSDLFPDILKPVDPRKIAEEIIPAPAPRCDGLGWMG